MKKLLFSLLSLLMVSGLAWADGVKISGDVTVKDYNGMLKNGTAILSSGDNAVATVSLGMDGNRNCYTYEFTEVASGTYTLSVTAEGKYNNQIYKKTETVEVASADVEHNIQLELYVEEGKEMTVNLGISPQYNNPGGNPALYGVTGTCKKKGAEGEGETKTSGSEGDPLLKFTCDTSGLYIITLHKDGYKDTTFETKSWEENYGRIMGRTLTVVMEAVPVVENDLVTLVGTVSLGTYTDITLSEKLQLVCKKEDGTTKTMTSDIQNGKYAFTGVPKNATYDSLSVVSMKYINYQQVPVASAMLKVKTPANGVLDLSSATPVNDTITYNNIELERIGFSVKGNVKNAANGRGLAQVTVKLGDVTTQTSYNGYGVSEGDFTFEEVTATQLSFEFSKEGFATLTKDTTISMAAVGADGVVTLTSIAMTPQAQEYTLAGKAGISPSTPLKDVVVELWSAPFVENQGYVKGNKLGADTTDADGAWSLKYTGFADDYVYLIAKHADIETEEMGRPISNLISLTSIDIYGSPILYGMVNCQATQDAQAATPTVNLTWEWPQALRNGYVNENGEGTYEITMVSIFRTVHRADQDDYTVKVCDTTTVSNTLPLTSFVDAGVQYPLFVDSTYTYHFTVNYSGKPDYKTIEVNDSANLTVKIAAKPVEPVKDSFDLWLHVNDTTMGKVEGMGKYEEGTRVNIKAIAKEGYVFEAWKTENGETEISKLAEYSFVLSSDSTLKAFFAAKPVEPVKEFFELKLQVNDTTMGKVEGMGKYEEGTRVNIKAIAKEGYVFEAWKAGETEISKLAEYSFVLSSDSTLKAFFVVKPVDPVKDSFELTLNCDATMGSVEGAGKYEKGTEVPVKATANEGYVFVAWMSGNDTVAKTAEHKITLVSDSTLTAVFAKKTANEDREQAAWNVYVEGQTIVLQSNAACQYDVYNLTGALVKRAKTNANEYRIAVNNSGLYIIRRISATGTSVKKVMVR